MEFQWEESPTQEQVAELTAGLPGGEALGQAILRCHDRVLLLRRTGADKPLGFVSYRLLPTSQLFDALGDTDLANRVRLRAAGNVLFLTALAADTAHKHKDYAQLLLSELLARALEKEYVYAVFAPHDGCCPPH